LELALGEGVHLHRPLQLQLVNHVVQNFQIASVIVLVLRVKIGALQLDGSRMNGVENLEVADCVTALLNFWVVSLDEIVEPGD